LGPDDVRKLLSSDISEKIVFELENFDNTTESFKTTPEFFQKLRKLKWDDRQTKKPYWAEKELYKKLNKLMFEVMGFSLNYPDFKDWSSKYRSTEDLFVQFLAACNAVNNGSLGIGIEDTIVTYKTFLKLIKTDVTKYKAIPERITDLDNHGAYLVCKECGMYYQTPEGESADDYSDYL